MSVKVLSFYDFEREDERPGIYSAVWNYFAQRYGGRINHPGKGSCFKGANGEFVVLTDRSPKNLVHEIVLIDVPSEVDLGLEKLLSKLTSKE